MLSLLTCVSQTFFVFASSVSLAINSVLVNYYARRLHVKYICAQKSLSRKISICTENIYDCVHSIDLPV